MAMLTISIEETVLYRLVADACAGGVSLDDQITKVLSGVAEAPKLMSAQAGLDIAIARAAAKNTGEKFSLEDLFSDDEWDQIPSRRVFGRMFRQKIESGVPPIARHDHKTATNHAVYERING
jgi:Domain of unknown function (DUF1413)